MTIDMQPMAQSVRTNRSSPFGSSNGNDEARSHKSASVSNDEDYDSDGSNFAPPTPMSLSMVLSEELAGAIPLIDKFQVEGFLRLMNKQIRAAGKRGFFIKKSVGPQVHEKFTFENMLCFQKDPIPTSLLKVSSDVVSRAVELFLIVLKYMGVDSSAGATSLDEQIELVRKLYKEALKRSELRDELFVQISKQTRNNCDRQWLIKAWELMYLCASCMPPSKDFGVYLSEYVNNVANGLNTDSEIKGIALNTLHALKCSIKAGRRHTIPGREEIEALLVRKRLTTIVFFLDETFEEITYDMSTTVADAVEELAGIIKLSAYSSFSLFECRKVVTGSKSLEPGNEEYIGLDDNKYIGDLLAEFKALKDRTNGEILHCKLIFKKRLFRESDEAVADPMFVQLSYVQLQHDYILGNYPVGREDAAQLSALQILVEIGFVDSPDTCTDWTTLLERFLSRQIAIRITRAKQEWEIDILSRYRSLDNLTKDDARQQFLRILRNLPYGNSVFFSVRKIDDPIGLLPERIILGINKRGVHFFRPVPKEYLHLAELRDIMRYSSSNTAVFFKMRVAGVLHKFQFETKQGHEVYVALQTHINDVMLRRYSKARSAASGSVNLGSSNRATSASGSNPSSPQNKKGCVDGGPIGKKPRIGKMVGAAAGVRTMQAFAVVNGSAPDLSQTASVAGSDCGAIEFSKEAVEALLNEKIKNKRSSLEERYDQMIDYVKRLRMSKGNFMDEQEKLQTMVNAVERRCNEAELFMKNEEELIAIIMELRKNYASAQEKVAKEESDKLAVTNCLAREKEARVSAEKLQSSLSEEVTKYQGELQASNRKLSSLNEMYKRLQEYNSSLQQYNTELESELAAANDNLKRVEKEKAGVVENLSTARGHNKSLQDISGASS